MAAPEPAAVSAPAPTLMQEASKQELAAPEGEDGFIQAIHSKDAALAQDTFAEQDPEMGAEGGPFNKRDSMSELPLLPDLERGDEDLPDRADVPEQPELGSSKESDPER